MQRFCNTAGDTLDPGEGVEPRKEVAVQTFVILWVPGPCWVEGTAIYHQPFIEDHADQLAALMTAGRVVLSGPFTPSARSPGSPLGMSVVRAADEAGLRAWLAEDPVIVHRVVTAELHPFQIVLVGGELRT